MNTQKCVSFLYFVSTVVLLACGDDADGSAGGGDTGGSPGTGGASSDGGGGDGGESGTGGAPELCAPSVQPTPADCVLPCDSAYTRGESDAYCTMQCDPASPVCPVDHECFPQPIGDGGTCLVPCADGCPDGLACTGDDEACGPIP